jgi:hypothetical protein
LLRCLWVWPNCSNQLLSVFTQWVGNLFLRWTLQCFIYQIPIEGLPENLEGAASVAKESGTIIIGGHTIDVYLRVWPSGYWKVHLIVVNHKCRLKPGKNLFWPSHWALE